MKHRIATSLPVTVRNRFAELASTGDIVTEEYGKFVKSIEETADNSSSSRLFICLT